MHECGVCCVRDPADRRLRRDPTPNIRTHPDLDQTYHQGRHLGKHGLCGFISILVLVLVSVRVEESHRPLGDETAPETEARDLRGR